jgi:hypothetical protein
MSPHSQADGGRFSDLRGEATVGRAVDTAGLTERVITAGFVVGGLWLVARSPLLRRVLWRVLREAMTTWIPLYVAHELKASWRASAPPGTPDRP